ncbi:hypothetical protein LCGC14_2271590 [marine sediment metagenome]|uniref:Predicted 3'-5' exonuclease PolB-like domain-containing protein n=1 Tax=marine sediment metagenome TaxID=412755 RepID=A0A0F9F9B3_9ZZZZ
MDEQRVVFDIETGPLSDTHLAAITSPFNPSDVKLGNLKDTTKIKAKLEQAELLYYANITTKAALHAQTGEVVAIGCKSSKGVELRFSPLGTLNIPEADLIAGFWLQLEETECRGQRMVGFASNTFDIPFLIRRSMILGIKYPKWIRRSIQYGDVVLVDLLQLWQCSDRHQYISLDVLCKLMGGEGKMPGVKPTDFAKLIKSGEARDRDIAINYLTADLEATWYCAGKMGV